MYVHHNTKESIHGHVHMYMEWAAEQIHVHDKLVLLFAVEGMHYVHCMHCTEASCMALCIYYIRHICTCTHTCNIPQHKHITFLMHGTHKHMYMYIMTIHPLFRASC